MNNIGKVFFGGIPKEYNNQYKYNTKCKANDNYVPWGCQINKLYVNNAEYNLKTYGIMSSTQMYMIISYYFYNIMTSTVYNNTSCHSIEDPFDNRKHLFCTDKTVIANTNGFVSFEFDNNIKATIKSDLLFNCKYKDGCESLFASNDKNHSLFQFGGQFLRLFNRITFDYDNKEITFSSYNIEIENGMFINNNRNKIVGYCIIITIISTSTISVY